MVVGIFQWGQNVYRSAVSQNQWKNKFAIANGNVRSLAMAEMTTLVAAVYMNYSTSIQEKQKGISPGITSRFEVFSDETFAEVGVRY